MRVLVNCPMGEGAYFKLTTMNKTAMQELIEAIELITKKFKRELSTEEILDMCSNQLDKEKEQIIDAHLNGQSDHHFSLESRTLEAEQHYNQTYKQNK